MIPAEIKVMLTEGYLKYFKPYQYIVLIVIISLIIGYLSVPFLGKNNPIEEAVEEIIRQETGISLELTPDPKAT